MVSRPMINGEGYSSSPVKLPDPVELKDDPVKVAVVDLHVPAWLL